MHFNNRHFNNRNYFNAHHRARASASSLDFLVNAEVKSSLTLLCVTSVNINYDALNDDIIFNAMSEEIIDDALSGELIDDCLISYIIADVTSFPESEDVE
jgi:hypothetical protein